MADPSSWLAVERGWTVIGSDGKEIGRVEQVLGDEEKDIFDGLAVATGLLGKPRYVPAERVSSIVEGSITVDLSKSDVDRLDTVD
jgi:sporulation protein YlmC with PRC-barrel domain